MNRNFSQWVKGKGPENDIVISSRIRLARNIEDIPYPNQAEEKDLKKTTELIKKLVDKQNDFNLKYYNINKLSDIGKKVMVERHLVSPPHAEGEKSHGVLINKDENISIMVNEEDHIRIQIIFPGLQLSSAWKKADEIDDYLEDSLDYAFSSKWGYLTACPTNMGTGLRASVMVHLPALNMTNNIDRMLGAVGKLGLAVRGLYGEGSESVGNIYQISNQITLGHSEKDILENLKSVTLQIIEQERQARQRLLKKQEIEVKDKIKRSYGTLKYAYKITNREALELLSYVKLGIDLEILNNITSSLLSELVILIRPAHLQQIVGKKLTPFERDMKRAELIQEKLNEEVN
ncbi:MAG: protein arginine kinase [Halanaerobiales bacterium]